MVMQQSSDMCQAAHQPSNNPEYNTAQYYWLQIMINNNNIDKNDALALTSDLIRRPFLYSMMYSIS